MDEQSVRQELIHSLEEWGVNDYSNKKHRDFRQHVLQEGCRQFKLCNDTSTFEHLRRYSDKNLPFPKEKEDAIRFFFQTELVDFISRMNDDILYEKADHLANGTSCYSNAPYYRLYEQNGLQASSSSRDGKKKKVLLSGGKKQGKVIGYRLKRQFEGRPLELLDPFNRFEYNFSCGGDRTSYIAEKLFDDWFNSDDPAWQGKIMEVLAAIHSIHHQPCFSCKHRGSIRWNGGLETSWMDLVCTQCHSTYEVKRKQSMDVCATQMGRNELAGGSYANYWSHRNAMESRRKRLCHGENDVDLQKMFLVIIPREESTNRSGQKIRPVYCVEIDHVLPKLTASSFRPLNPPCVMSKRQRHRYSVLPIGSVIKTKTQQQRHRHDATTIGVVWFQMVSQPIVDVFEIMKDVFVEHYGDDEYDRIDRLYRDNDEDENNEKSEERPDTDEEEIPNNNKNNKKKKFETDEEIGRNNGKTTEVDDDIAKLTKLVEQTKTLGVDGSDGEWENLYSDSDSDSDSDVDAEE